MKTLEDVKHIITKFNVKLRPDMRSKVLVEALEIQRRRKQQSTSGGCTWRLIVKHRITKFVASAACITISIALCLWLLFGRGMVQPAYAELVEVMKSSMHAEWLHAVIQRYDGIKNDSKWTWVKTKDFEQEEVWFSLQPFQQFSKRGNGYINLVDYAKRRAYSYDPNSKTLTIDYDNAPDLAQEYRAQCLRDVLPLSAPQDSKIIKTQKKINGKTFTVFDKDGPGEEEPIEGYEQWLVDPETKLVTKYEEVNYEEKKKNIVIYRYPKKGPADIYALGVPRDIKVVNLAPPREIETLVDNAIAAEKQFPNVFFAIECKLLDSLEDSVPPARHPSGYMPFQEGTRLYNVDNQIAPAAVITVTYRKGDNGRRDIYPIWISEYSDLVNYLKELKEVQKTIPVENNEALKAWTQSRLPSQIITLSNCNAYLFQLDRNGSLVKLPYRNDPRDRAALLNINFWRPPDNRYDLDHYYEPLATQTSQWGELVGIAIGGERYKCYYNPERNYICERASREFSKLEPLRGFTRNVLQYANTSNGNWYPKKTVFVQDKASYLFVRYIDDNCSIDDKLFDEDSISASHLASLDRE